MGHYKKLCTLFLVIYDIVLILSEAGRRVKRSVRRSRRISTFKRVLRVAVDDQDVVPGSERLMGGL